MTANPALAAVLLQLMLTPPHCDNDPKYVSPSPPCSWIRHLNVPGVQTYEVKTKTPSGVGKYEKQLENSRTDKLSGNVGIFMYDETGAMFFVGTYNFMEIAWIHRCPMMFTLFVIRRMESCYTLVKPVVAFVMGVRNIEETSRRLESRLTLIFWRQSMAHPRQERWSQDTLKRISVFFTNALHLIR
jgi:hypothetical protein